MVRFGSHAGRIRGVIHKTSRKHLKLIYSICACLPCFFVLIRNSMKSTLIIYHQMVLSPTCSQLPCYPINGAFIVESSCVGHYLFSFVSPTCKYGMSQVCCFHLGETCKVPSQSIFSRCLKSQTFYHIVHVCTSLSLSSCAAAIIQIRDYGVSVLFICGQFWDHNFLQQLMTWLDQVLLCIWDDIIMIMPIVTFS